MQHLYTIQASGILEKLTEEEFFQFCQMNKDLRIERNKNQEIIIMSPTGLKSGEMNAIINAVLTVWNMKSGLGHTFDSSTGFTLPDQSMLSPDASWIAHARYEQVAEQDKNKFAAICPDFVIELSSASDNFNYLTEKMYRWIANGVQVAWLINPEDQSITVFRADGSVEVLDGFDRKLEATDLLPGFELDLSLLKF